MGMLNATTGRAMVYGLLRLGRRTADICAVQCSFLLDAETPTSS